MPIEADVAQRQTTADDHSHVESCHAEGLAALRGNRNEEAIQWFQLAVASAHADASSWGLLGLARKRMGQTGEAINCYRRALEIDPSHCSTLLNLARALRETGSLEDAINHFQRALAVEPSSAEAWSMLSNALRESNQLTLALDAADTAIRIDPWLAQGHLNRGAALHQLGRLTDACVSYCIAGVFEPSNKSIGNNLSHAMQASGKSTGSNDAETLRLVRRLTTHGADAAAWNALALVEQNGGNYPNAIACLIHSVTCAPLNETLRTLAGLLWDRGLRPRAKQHALRAVAQNDHDYRAHRLLAKWLAHEREFAPAEQHWRKVVAQRPSDAAAWINLGAAIARQGRPIEATQILERAIELQPNAVEAHINLGAALSDQGRFAEARATYQRGLQLDPQRLELVSNALFSTHFDPAMSPDTILTEHRTGAVVIEASAPTCSRAVAQYDDAERRLRIGYVSPDFHDHPVAYLLEPVLREHDSANFEVFCYSDVQRVDAVTNRIRSLAHNFTDCTGLSNAALTERVVHDKIDILVDLAGHTAYNRLVVFASKPSPIQVSWLGYFDTTGLHAIDYRLADRFSVPEGLERYFVEKIFRLARSSNCYLPPAAPPVASAPFLKNGYITFGCYNNPAKLTRQVISAFARILKGVERSRIILKYGAFSDPAMQARYSQWFADESIAPDRIEIRGHSPMLVFLESLGDIDIALDPFPYSGETTALHSLWMGVPLIAAEGQTMVQRLASRVLNVAGFSQWVAHNVEEYVNIAIQLANDQRALLGRDQIRERLLASPIMDARGITRDVEDAFRCMWREYCQSNRPE